MAKNKIIGIVGYRSADDKSFGAGINYLKWISSFGDVRIIMPHEDLVEVDLLLLPGGADLNPTCYGQVPDFMAGDMDVHKQYFYDHKLKLYIENKTPIFGICLGFQQIAAFFGCSLKQHLLFHPTSKDRWEAGHEVTIIGPKMKKLSVNSHHHQGLVNEEVNREELDILAVTKDTGDGVIVEAIKHKTLPIAGVQFHPEEWYDDFSTKLVNDLLNYKK